MRFLKNITTLQKNNRQEIFLSAKYHNIKQLH